MIHDDDDTWEPGYLEACVSHMDAADPCVGGVVTLVGGAFGLLLGNGTMATLVALGISAAMAFGFVTAVVIGLI